DVTVTPGNSVDIQALQKKLSGLAPHALLDDHRRWIGELRGTANEILLGALSILLLIALATSATVAFATRAGLEAHHEIVELLHFMGARDKFIARAFEWHYFFAALIAAAAGALAAAAIFLAAGGIGFANLPAVSFLPPISLTAREFPWLISIPAG